MPDTGGPTTIQLQKQQQFELTLKVTGTLNRLVGVVYGWFGEVRFSCSDSVSATVARLELVEELVVWQQKNVRSKTEYILVAIFLK
jgi:hypothetical protein